VVNLPFHRARAIVLTASALVFAAAVPAGAQLDDEGTFEIRVNGRVVGTEEFTIRQRGSGPSGEVVATGRVQIELPSGSIQLTPRLRGTGLQADPVAYEVTVGGDAPQRIVGTVAGGRFSARIASGTGERLREYVVTRGAVILDDAVAHHYTFLAQRTRSGTVPVIIPRQNRQVMATVVHAGEERVTIGDRTHTLFRLRIELEGLGVRHLWVDALNRVYQVEIPETGYSAVRIGP
jgi:hypothetical protein